MQKKQKQIILLLLLIAAAAAALFSVKWIGEKNRGADAVFLNHMDADRIDFISYQDGDKTIILSKNAQDEWTAPSEPERKLRQQLCRRMTTQSGYLRAGDVLAQPQKSLADYGLQYPCNRIVLKSGEETEVYLIGDANAATGDYYLQKEGEKEIYTVSKDFVSAFSGDYAYLTDPEKGKN